MTEFHVEVVRIGAIEKHPNADTLSVTKIRGGYPVAFRTGEYREGDLAVYVPVDAVVPTETPRFAFLGEHRRIRAKRLRGLFSMGLLTPAEPAWGEGQDVAGELGVTKYEPPVVEEGSADETDPGFMPVYTDVEGLRRWPDVLVPGEYVVVTEKIHGENFRAVFADGRLWVGSRTRVKKRDATSKWWQAALAAGLEEKLAKRPGVVVYGEAHGYTGGFPYGTGRTPTLRVFDALDMTSRTYFDANDFDMLVGELGLTPAPQLHNGPWSPDLATLAEGRSTLDATHVREGFVVRPVKERMADCGRVILKLHGEGFLLK